MPLRLINPLPTSNLAGDLIAGIRAAAVAMPLALAFGVLSGAGPIAGFYGAICVGLFAALFGGTPSQISGPTGPTALVMAAVFTRYGAEPVKAFTVVMMSGAFQILFGALRLGRYINLMPYPVTSGWASGIGTVIIIMQLAPLLGHPRLVYPTEAISALPSHVGAVEPQSLFLGLMALGVCYLTPERVNRVFPTMLLALILGTVLGTTVFTQAPTLGDIATGLPTLQWPVWSPADIYDMLFAALMIALLGSIDSLLASLAADTATNTLHNSDRELVGQGIGNLVAGLLGGIPGAGATLRTMTNIRAGGRTALSGAACALLLFAAVLVLGTTISYVPAAVLAGLLIRIAINTIDWRYLKRIRTAPRSGLVLMFTVLALTVIYNLIVAIAAGTVLASLLFVKRMADLQLASVRTIDNPAGEASLTEEEAEAMAALGGRALLIQLSGPISFGAASRLHRRISGYQEYDVVILDLTNVPAVDSSATLALENIILNARGKAHDVILVGLSTAVARTFARLGVLSLIKEIERHPTRLEALQYARSLVQTDSDADTSRPAA